MRISTQGIVVSAALLALALLPLTGCKKKHKPDFSTPVGIVKSYIWAIDHHDCAVLEKVVAGKFKRHLEKRGKDGCHRIMKAYAKSRGNTKFSDLRVVKTGDPVIFYEEEGRVIVSMPLTRQDREDVAYFDVERTDRGWQVVGENSKPPRWYTGPAPQLDRPDIRPDAPTTTPGSPTVTPPAPPPAPEPASQPAPAPAPEPATAQPSTAQPPDSQPPTTAPPAPPVTEKGPSDMGGDDSHGGDDSQEAPPVSDELEDENHP